MIAHFLKYTLEYYWFKILPSERVEKLQVEKFNKLLSTALKKSQFYKDEYTDIPEKDREIKSIADLKKLPVVSKEDMLKYTTQEILTRPKSDKLIKRSTSGSTGKPFDTFLSKKEYFTSYFRTFFSLSKYNPFKPFVLVGVYKQKEDIEHQTFLYYAQKYLGLFRREAYSVFTSTQDIVDKLSNRNIHILSATPSYCKILTDHLKKNGAKLNIRYVVLFGETLFDDVKRDINMYLGAKVINVYGCMEHPTLAWTPPNADWFRYPLNSIVLEYINPIEKNGEICFQVVPKEGGNHKHITNKILKRWKENFSGNMPTVQFVNDLPINPKTGKFKNIEVER